MKNLIWELITLILMAVSTAIAMIAAIKGDWQIGIHFYTLSLVLSIQYSIRKISQKMKL